MSSKLPKLIEEINSRAQWYYRGFWNLIQEGCEQLILYDGKKAEGKFKRVYKNKAQENLKIAQQIYDTIPLQELETSPDYDIFSETKKCLDQLCEIAEKVLDDKKEMYAIEPLPQRIFELGQEYRKRLKNLEEKIQNRIKNYNEWNYGGEDINGKRWEVLF
jgi:hypothetical protein